MHRWAAGLPARGLRWPLGHQELLDILADPTHEEHRERLEWIGHPIDPEAFDPSDFERNLREGAAAHFEH